MDVAIAVVGGYCGCLGIVAASAVNTKTVGCMYLLCNFFLVLLLTCCFVGWPGLLVG